MGDNSIIIIIIIIINSDYNSGCRWSIRSNNKSACEIYARDWDRNSFRACAENSATWDNKSIEIGTWLLKHLVQRPVSSVATGLCPHSQ